jgi:uncharacterized protein YggE
MIVPALFLLLGLVQAPSELGAVAKPVTISGEVPLEVAAKGVSILPADKATIVLNLTCTAETSAEAKRLVRDRADGLVRELVLAGVPAGNISVDDSSRVGFIGNEAMEAAMNAAQPSVTKPKRSAYLAVTVTFGDLSLLARVQGLLDHKDAVTLESPLYELSDSRAAKRAAIADAVRKARDDADAYAASLGMRVSRLAQIRDQSAQASPFGDSAELLERMVQQKGASKGKVETDVRIAVEFILAPR